MKKLLLNVLLFVPLIAVSFFFSISIVKVEALGATVALCFDQTKSNGGLLKAATGTNGEPVCPTTHRSIGPFNDNNPRFPGICIGPVPGQNGAYGWSEAELIGDETDPTPEWGCPDIDGIPKRTFFPAGSITQYVPPGGPPINTNTNTNTNNGNNNKNTNNGNTNTTPPTRNQGKCEAGFYQSGPLCVPENPFASNPDSILNTSSIGELAARIIKILLFFAGIIAVVMIIIAGYQIMTARGDEGQAKNGRKTLTNAIIGLVIVVLSYAIIQALVNFITRG